MFVYDKCVFLFIYLCELDHMMRSTNQTSNNNKTTRLKDNEYDVNKGRTSVGDNKINPNQSI